jgi:two-component system chemotaxis response regulator CheB
VPNSEIRPNLDPDPNPGSRAEAGDGAGAELKRVRVLIVDDSALMRRLLSDILAGSPEIEVIGVARNGREAVLQTARLRPDVVTLDVEMPEVSGLDALPAILAAHETRVVMVSALTQEGADVTLQALEFGAIDFLPKPERNQLAEMRSLRDLLVSKIVAASQSRARRARRLLRPLPKTTAASTSTLTSLSTPAGRDPGAATAGRGNVSLGPASPPSCCVVIGISTGGPQSLSQVFPLLSPPVPPILVVQHMPAPFTGVFAERLNRSSGVPVVLATDNDRLVADRIVIAPGGQHMSLAGSATRPRITLSDPDAPLVSGHRPSIDVLFESAARIFRSAAVGILMTGMGRDGVAGCQAILAAGGNALGQDEATSIVYGMNKAAFLENAVRRQFALEELPAILKALADSPPA